MFSNEDIKTIISQITARMNGGMKDEDFECFKSMLNNIAIEPRCKICKDYLSVFDPVRGYSFLCICQLQAQRERDKGKVKK